MKGITKAKGVISMLLKDADGKQIVLNQNPLTKDINVINIWKNIQKCWQKYSKVSILF